jgi:hypothetical protein
MAAGATIVVHAARTKLRRAAALFSFMALLAVGEAIFLSEGIAARVGFALAAVFFAALTALAARRASRTDPVLVVGTEGLEHRTIGFVPWSDIAEISVVDGSSGPRLEIHVYDETEYLRRVSALVRPVVRLNLTLGHGLLSISERALDTRVAYLRAQIEGQAPNALSR